jgi:hypothetical protein
MTALVLFWPAALVAVVALVLVLLILIFWTTNGERVKQRRTR